jgi:uncharacterized protein (DUF4415 family)
MSTKPAFRERSRAEPTLQEEIAALGDDDLMDFMNLTSLRTGVSGIVFISTAMGPHGPRVKYFVKTGKGQPSFSVSIAADPKLVASSLPDRVTNQMAPAVIAWVKLNHDVLTKFWNEGETWTDDEVDAFRDRLKPLQAA